MMEVSIIPLASGLLPAAVVVVAAVPIGYRLAAVVAILLNPTDSARIRDTIRRLPVVDILSTGLAGATTTDGRTMECHYTLSRVFVID